MKTFFVSRFHIRYQILPVRANGETFRRKMYAIINVFAAKFSLCFVSKSRELSRSREKISFRFFPFPFFSFESRVHFKDMRPARNLIWQAAPRAKEEAVTALHHFLFI